MSILSDMLKTTLGTGILILIVLLVFVFNYISMKLWNGVLVYAVTFVNPVTYWQMFGLVILAYLIIPRSINIK